jgi:hypothetical protein
MNDTFYYCDLKSNNIDCPQKLFCKRYDAIKDMPYQEYEKLGCAKLYNICNDHNGYKMKLKLDEKEEQIDEREDKDQIPDT